VCITTFPSGLCTTAINALQPPQPSPAQSNTQKQEQEGKDKIVQTEEEEQPLSQQQPKHRDNKDTTTYWDIQ
jgi:hypothetical protein